MRGSLARAARRISNSRRRRQAWQRIVRGLAMVVVFCTTYALILPAITMHSDAVCGMKSHTHTADCYEVRPVTELICTHTDTDDPTHQHEDSCWTDTGETVEELICTLPEHTHTADCYPVEPETVPGNPFRCGYGEHIHSEGCFDAEGLLSCTLAEHTHQAGCIVENLDLTADMESAGDWEAMAAGLELTGDWSRDLLTVAVSQIGYAESERNCILDGEELRGYTRYGDWYGNPYLPWDDLFVAFCLHYGGAPEDTVPRESGTDRWFAQLEQQGMLREVEASLAEPGRVIFFRDETGRLYTAVVQCIETEDTDLDSLQLRVIAGDVNGRVENLIVALDSVLAVLDPDQAENPPLPGENTEPEETEPEETKPEETEPEETEPEETEPAAQLSRVVQTAETDNYIVTVSYSPELELPEGAQLRVTEYSKDSEIYHQRCQEAGYELDWLLNIGFFLGDEELPLSGDFDVVVTSRHGDALGQDITHFSDSGAERLDADAQGQEDQTSVSFSSEGFSDFGGGIALAAAEDVAVIADGDALGYYFVTANPAQLQEGVDYAIYCGNGRNLTFLNSSLSAISVTNTQDTSAPYSIGGAWNLTSDQMGTTSSSVFTWRIVKENGQTYLVCRQNQQRLTFHNGWLQLTGGGTALNNRVSGAGAYVGGTYKLRYDDQWRATWTSGNYSTQPTLVYFAQVTDQGPNYPHAVHTGEVDISRLRFYNLCENGDSGVSALEGCVFEITGDNGYTATVVSGPEPEVNLPADIPDGSYTIREVSVPDGYLKDTEHTRTFEVKNGALVSDRTIGTFINHNVEQLVADKTAQVADYRNRIYRIDLSARSNMRTYEMDPIDVLFVVDQSNSMLFPSGLVDTGKRVTLRLDGTNNVANLEALNLDKTQMHYVIADPTGTSTVWCIWHDGTAWMCQDASYYAKAKHSNDAGYQDDNETAIFPSNQSYKDQAAEEPDGVRSNGGGLGYSLSGSSLGKDLDAAVNDTKTYTLYTSTDEYNRLHYLEEALANLIYQMADVNDANRITLTRFTKEVAASDCYGPVELTPDNTEELVRQVTSIKTSGGTRQDIALKHIYQEHLNDAGEHYSDLEHTYTLLITDGAPVLSSNGGLTNLGGPYDAATTTGDTVYGQIKGYADQVKMKSTLMTVGLGMESVEAGKSVLEQIATNNNFYCALDDASELIQFIQKLLFDSFRPKEKIDISGDVEDEISDSFYPIAWVEDAGETENRILLSDSSGIWVLLEENDWITLDGRLTASGADDAAGQLLRRADGTFYVKWTDQNMSDSTWNGTFYVKAKEDFIGGNAIDTNKTANITVRDGGKLLETPTVNVRLLDLNEMDSEVTVYLGDQVNGEGSSPLDSLKYFFDNTKFTKLISDGGEVLNRITVEAADGLEEAFFYLRYAMGQDLTQEQWQQLANGDAIQIPYTYDDDSSHGPVGYFTFRLEKSGLGSAYGQHEAVSACQSGGRPPTDECDEPAETYTLNVTYTAYGLGRNGRPAKNVHNGTGGPGTEVGTGTAVENGLGTLTRQNVHRVHVISGRIEITKRFADGVTDEADRTFTFTLHRQEDGTDTSKDVTKTITIPANSAAGEASIIFDDLRRGTYTVTEAADEDYALARITVLDTTDCYSEPPIGTAATQLICIMGNNVANENVIGKAAETDRYTSYTDPVNGVYCAAEFVNAPIVYTAEIPVEKIWSNQTEDHGDDMVYVALYLNEAPVLDGDGNARLLRLDEASGWKGIFTVTLADENDSLDNYSYSIREVSQIRTDGPAGWTPAILENDGVTRLWYETALESGKQLHLGNRSYMVEYGAGENGLLTVTNHRTVDLPMTGGTGTHMYTFGGMLLIAAALIFGFSQRRKRERGARD